MAEPFALNVMGLNGFYTWAIIHQEKTLILFSFRRMCGSFPRLFDLRKGKEKTFLQAYLTISEGSAFTN